MIPALNRVDEKPVGEAGGHTAIDERFDTVTPAEVIKTMRARKWKG